MAWIQKLEYLRRNGYTVAVHNDYRQDGKLRTFWLLIDSEGYSYKGEGDSDEAAFNEIAAKLSTVDAHGMTNDDDDIVLAKYIEQQKKLSLAQRSEELAQKFHEAYERLAPSFGYETRKASAKPWAEVPENNRRLMTAVCAELLGGSK